ncbi:hypothetical protein COU76_02405 [Candidatus Peregrinibacteria bacterium CG10_big_fil_rev_8_21_14_0_10_49_10]|nr:MAG: hypothetical protein COU76_02405 [Candidatus Peregrinibacteria bacterium CG10_big_fil_rev_8_21_14_0_10_49_10]
MRTTTYYIGSRRLHSLVASIIFFLLPLSALAFGLQVIIEGKSIVFADVSQSAWFSGYVRSAAEAGIVTGYKDTQGNLKGTFGPSNSITVAESLKIAVEGAGYNNEQYGAVVNSGVNHWSSSYVSVANAEHFQVFDGRYRLDVPATRAQVAALFTSAFGVNTSNVSIDKSYDDVTVNSKYATSIMALTRDGVVSGDTNTSGTITGSFRPDDPINRAEVAKMVMEARAVYGTPGKGREPAQSNNQETKIVTYTTAGFSPTILRMKKGEYVEFRNESNGMLWIASDPHPYHTNLPSFDSLKAYKQGESYVYTFTKIGTWGFHNHLNPSHKGTIVVE